jgi:hypothetical protein
MSEKDIFSADVSPPPAVGGAQSAVPTSSASSGEVTSSPTTEKTGRPLDIVHADERGPGHPTYYEKDGLRTYGDGEDHDHEPPVTHSSMRATTNG